MKIEFRRSGGFAGLGLRLEVDSAVLPRGESRLLEALVGRARLAELAGPAAEALPDSFQYDIAIEDGAQRTTVCLRDPGLPEQARPLIERLVAMARTARTAR